VEQSGFKQSSADYSPDVAVTGRFLEADS